MQYRQYLLDKNRKKDVMLSLVEAWWVGLYARPFDKLRVTGRLFVFKSFR